ncbi:MAG: hypothetical protein V1820_01735 [archaeon]
MGLSDEMRELQDQIYSDYRLGSDLATFERRFLGKDREVVKYGQECLCITALGNAVGYRPEVPSGDFLPEVTALIDAVEEYRKPREIDRSEMDFSSSLICALVHAVHAANADAAYWIELQDARGVGRTIQRAKNFQGRYPNEFREMKEDGGWEEIGYFDFDKYFYALARICATDSRKLLASGSSDRTETAQKAREPTEYFRAIAKTAELEPPADAVALVSTVEAEIAKYQFAGL